MTKKVSSPKGASPLTIISPNDKLTLRNIFKICRHDEFLKSLENSELTNIDFFNEKYRNLAKSFASGSQISSNSNFVTSKFNLALDNYLMTRLKLSLLLVEPGTDLVSLLKLIVPHRHEHETLFILHAYWKYIQELCRMQNPEVPSSLREVLKIKYCPKEYKNKVQLDSKYLIKFQNDEALTWIDKLLAESESWYRKCWKNQNIIPTEIISELAKELYSRRKNLTILKNQSNASQCAVYSTLSSELKKQLNLISSRKRIFKLLRPFSCANYNVVLGGPLPWETNILREIFKKF